MSTWGAVDVARRLGLPEPTPEQVAVIEAPLEPVLVVAGAGSGKTETMTARVVHLVVNGLVDRDRVLGLTFTRKAAGELAERVRRRLRAFDVATGRRADPAGALMTPTVATYNAYAAGLVGEHALRLGVEPSARVLGEAGRWQIAHEVVESWAGDLEVDLAPGTVTAAVLSLAGAFAEHLVPPEELRTFADRWVETLESLPSGGRTAMPAAVRDVRDTLRLRGRLVDLVQEFTVRKRERDLVDFGDQVALAARLAAEVPEVGAAERARYGVVLLDEYQDTSVAQLALLRHLFGDLGEGAGHPVTAVGDPHQSIYGWRGASAGGLERFPEQFPRAGGEGPASVLDLATSWRNDRAVLAAANAIAEPLRAAAQRVSLPLLGPRPGAGDGEVVVAVTETSVDEARTVAEHLAARRAELAGRRGDGPVTAAVLCRRRAQFPVLHRALVEAGLPVEVVGLGGLLSVPEVVDLVATLEAVHDPSRGDSLMRLLTGPRARLGLADVHALADWAAHIARRDVDLDSRGPDGRPVPTADALLGERSIVDALDELPPPGWVSRHDRRLSTAGRERLDDLARVLRRLRGQTYLPVTDLVAEAERLLGLDIEVAARPDPPPGGPRVHLDAFRAVAEEFDTDEASTLGAFLAWLGAAQREERGLELPVTEMDPGAVQILTVHAAKGLEWDVVAVPGLVERTFPVAQRTSGWVSDRGALPAALRGDREGLPDVDLGGAADLAEVARRLKDYATASARHHGAEERRLAYVAMTRARSHLLLTASRWRDGARPAELSTFLTEICDERGRNGIAVTVLAWAPEPPDDAARPPDPTASEPASWPAERPLGGRQDAVEAAAAAVRAAMSADPVEQPAPGDDLAATVDLLLEERRRKEADRTSVAMPAHLAASAVVRMAADPEAFALQLRRPVPLPPSTQARRGTAFHAWVERYYGAAALVDVDALPGADDETVGEDPGLDELRARFLASPWAGRRPIAVEVDVETPVAGVVLRSRIDAVFAEPGGGVVVVDWKTGRAPTDPDVVRSRELQLAVYRIAWSRRTGVPLDAVSAVFVHVATGETVGPTEPLDEARVEGVLRRAVGLSSEAPAGGR